MGREQGALKWVMTNTPTDAPLLLWLTPALLALLLYGLGQGFVKMWITEVPPARFCLYFACARAVVMGFYFLATPHTPVFAAEGRHVLVIGVLAYLLDGTGWIMYFESISAGPITIVGTLSAAYPALTIVFAHWFLGETLSPLQYGAVTLVKAEDEVRGAEQSHPLQFGEADRTGFSMTRLALRSQRRQQCEPGSMGHSPHATPLLPRPAAE
jgi:uncharacterized membrane protein